MPVAYSELPIYQGTISANPATFLDALNTALVGIGWTSAVYSTGYVYSVVSPQGLAVQVRIWDPADSNFAGCFVFQWLQAASPFAVGQIHHLRMDAAVGHAVWANCCSLFIGRHSVTHTGDNYPWSVCGGVPWATGLTTPTAQCAAQSPSAPDVTDELWFSSGSDSGDALFATATLESFRSGHICKRFTWCRNGVVTTSSGVNEAAALQLSIMRPPGYTNNNRPSGFESGILYRDFTPMASEPLLSLNGRWDGQLWDACLLSAPYALEAAETIFETVSGFTTSWINHALGNTNILFRPDDGRMFALMLLTGGPVTGGDGNVAY